MEDTTQRFRSLDALRGIAALTVALGHFGVLNGFTHSYHLAVDFFLVLSGFVLTHSYFRSSRLSLKQFIWRRWARMYPLHLLSLLLVLALYLEFNKPVEKSALLLHLLFIHNMGLGPAQLSFNVPSWTISVEFWLNAGMYLFILALGSGLRRRTIGALIGITAASFFLLIIFAGHLDYNAYDFKQVLNSGLVRCVASFSLGILAYQVYLHFRVPFSGSAYELLALVMFLFPMLSPWRQTAFDFAGPVFFFCAIMILTTSHGAVSRLLARLGYLGDISFSIYLLHYPLVIIARQYLPDESRAIDQVLMFTLLTLLTSAASYRWVEAPLYQRLKRMY